MEKTPSTDRVHWQGYVELVDGRRFTLATIKRRIFVDDTVHIESRFGTQDEAITYCKKDEEMVRNLAARRKHPRWVDKWLNGENVGLRVAGTTVQEFGTPKVTRQGQRSDLQGFMDDAKSGMSIEELRETHAPTMAKYTSFCREFANAQQRYNQPLFREVKVTVYWGHTGFGKTRRVFWESPDLYKLDVCEAGHVWFCGYEGEDVILIDDFYGWIPIGQLLNLLDVYPVRLQIKGGHTWAQWKQVYITSNVSPDDWYRDATTGGLISAGQRSALQRRLGHVLHVNTQWEPPNEHQSEEEEEVAPVGPVDDADRPFPSSAEIRHNRWCAENLNESQPVTNALLREWDRINQRSE